MKMTKSLPNETIRLRFRPLNLADAHALFDFRSNKTNFPFVDMSIWDTVSQANKYIEKIIAGHQNEDWYFYALVLKSVEEMVGSITLWNFNSSKTCAEVGYSLFPKFQHQGYMHEALMELCDFGFKTLGLKTIIGYAQKDNLASIQVLIQAGFHFRSDAVDIDSQTNQELAMSVYAIDRTSI